MRQIWSSRGATTGGLSVVAHKVALEEAGGLVQQPQVDLVALNEL